MGSGVLRDLRGNKGTEEKPDRKEYRQPWRCMEVLETLESVVIKTRFGASLMILSSVFLKFLLSDPFLKTEYS